MNHEETICVNTTATTKRSLPNTEQTFANAILTTTKITSDHGKKKNDAMDDSMAPKTKHSTRKPNTSKRKLSDCLVVSISLSNKISLHQQTKLLFINKRNRMSS